MSRGKIYKVAQNWQCYVKLLKVAQSYVIIITIKYDSGAETKIIAFGKNDILQRLMNLDSP